MADRERHLFPLFLDQVKASWKQGGFWRVLPWVLGLCVGAGYAVSRFAPAEIFAQAQWGTVTSIYSGVLTFNGITLALTWAAIGKVYETISRGEFSRFLRAAGALDDYQFYIQFMHLIQILAAVSAVVALFVTYMPVPENAKRIAMGVVVATTLYAIKWASGSVRVARDLTDHQTTFDRLTEDEKRRVWLAASNGGGE